jgi:hypothetical protein
MLNYVQSGLFVLAAIAISAVIMAVLNRVWPIPKRKLINDVTGWQLGILGTTYGVILGFMLYTVWNDFHIAEVNANLEATLLVTASPIAEALPSPEWEAFYVLGLKYAEVAIQQDWPSMQHQRNEYAARRS